MSKLSRWIVDGIVAVALGYVLKQFIFPLTKALALNAMLGWIDDKIGETLGITGQTAISWAFAFGLGALIFWLYHIIQIRVFRAPTHATSEKVTGLQSTPRSYRPTTGELPPQFFRWRWWYEFWGGPPFHVYAARKRLEFMDSWQQFADQRRQQEVKEARTPGITTSATAKVFPAAQYSKAQINRILEAIDAFYPPLVEIEQTLKSGTWLAGSLEAIIRDRGAAQLLAEMDQIRLTLIVPLDRLDKAVEQFGLYTEVCRVLDERQSQKDAFFSAFNDLVGVLRQIPDELSAPALAIFVETKKATFIERTTAYFVWAQQKKKALAEYRDWYLRRPTTD